MKLFNVILVTLVLLISTEVVQAADNLVFDSTDNYIGGCQMTNKSSWELANDLTVSKFQIWYKWDTGETVLPITILKNGEEFASFEAKRGDCDPYQTTWCNADYIINRLFPAGKYSTEIPDSRQCLKPNGTGTVRLYSNDDQVARDTPLPTQALNITVQPSGIQPAAQNNAATEVTPACNCNQIVTIASAAILSSALSVAISLLLRKK